MSIPLTTEYLMTLTQEERDDAIIKERVKCYVDRKYLIETYFTVDAGGTRKPFKLYPHQKKALKAYIKYQNNITMKSRQMGFTTFTSAYIACELINFANFKTLIISKEMGSAQDFVKNIKEILDRARELTRFTDDPLSESWLIPAYADGYNNKQSFHLTNGSFVKAQGNTEDAGRGISGLNLAVVDEVAFIDRKSPERMKEIWAAMGPAMATVKGKAIFISTPYGSNSFYYDIYTNAEEKGFNKIESHWTAHPYFKQGTYQWIIDNTNSNGGYLKFYGDDWPDELLDIKTNTYQKIDRDKYQFVCDGKIRSPWYDAESKKLGAKRTACELDCSFVGTGGEVLPGDMLREINAYSQTIEYKKPFPDNNGHIAGFRQYKEYIEGHEYVVASDVMTGDGSDYSTAVVLDLNTLDICGTLKIQIIPKYLAGILARIGYMYGTAPLVVENQGGGSTTLQELKEIKYPYIYYSTLNKKDETLGTKKRKIGLWVSDDVRTKGGDKLEQLIIDRELKICCVLIVSELYNWIWDSDGKRRHAPGKHDDLIMALQHAVYYMTYVFKRNRRNREAFNKSFSTDANNQFGGNGYISQSGETYNPLNPKKSDGLLGDGSNSNQVRRTIFL